VPEAVTEKTASAFTLTVTSWGCTVIAGGTGEEVTVKAAALEVVVR